MSLVHYCREINRSLFSSVTYVILYDNILLIFARPQEEQKTFERHDMSDKGEVASQSYHLTITQKAKQDSS